MSALPLEADIGGGMQNVRFVPIADISRLFDHRVGALKPLRSKGWQAQLRNKI
jgi:hypothetical protein